MKTIRTAILDFCLFSLLLAAVNVGVAPNDPLWLDVNPTPWLLLPVYIGARYGISAGSLTGILLAILAGVCAAGQNNSDLSTALLSHRFVILGFILGGLLTGAVRTMANRNSARQAERCGQLDAENQRLRSDYELLEETRYLLQERLALFGSETAALDTQIRTLFAPGSGPIFPGLLEALKDVAHVESAAILSSNKPTSGQANVLAALDSKWGSETSVVLPAIARAALAGGRTVTWQAGAKHDAEPFLAAVPFGEDAVVLIERMPFAKVTRHAFVLIDTIVTWVGQHAFEASGQKEAAETQLELSTDEFSQREKLARETFDKLRLPSTIAEFEISRNGNGVADRLQQALKENVRAPRVLCRPNKNTFRVLLPMEGVRDAENFTTILQKQLTPGQVVHKISAVGVTASNGSGRSANEKGNNGGRG